MIFRKKKLPISDDELKWRIELRLREIIDLEKLTVKQKLVLIEELFEMKKKQYLNGGRL